MDEKIITQLQDKVILVIISIVAFTLTAVSSFGSTFHRYLVNGIVEYRFYTTPLTYLLMYVSFVFLALVLFTIIVFLRELNHARK
jgi:large-conductance mechanosensitive channel